MSKSATLLLLISLIFSTTARSNNDVISIKKGTPAPFTGILFTEDKAKELRTDLLELDKSRIILLSKEQQLGIFQERLELRDEEIELYHKQNERLVKQNGTNKDVGMVERVVWFGLGVVVTGAAVYAAGSLAR